MARMIPATISPDVKSSAERKIFKWLQNLEWQNCIVLHSLEMAEHVDNIFGEIDFVIIADDGVLCIEVKELLENGKYKEVKHCSVAYGFADVNLFMDYEKYVEASMDEKKSMIVKNVVDSVKAIKTKGKIDFNHFKEDMMSFCEISGINYY